jgi:hypothetical protein
VKLFVARFWSDFKESEAVCANYFCEVVPFLGIAENRGGDFGSAQSKAESFLYETKKRFGIPASLGRAWTRPRCPAEGFAIRQEGA